MEMSFLISLLAAASLFSLHRAGKSRKVGREGLLFSIALINVTL